MEQKKTLWIVAATGIFLLVVFGAALIINSRPLTSSEPRLAGYNPDTGWTNPQQTVTPVPNSGLALSPEGQGFQSQETAQTLPPSPFEKSGSVSDNAPSAQNSEAPLHTDRLTVISDNTTVYSNESTTMFDLNSLKTSSNSGLVAKNEMTAGQIQTKRAEEPSSEKARGESLESYYTPPARSAAKSAPAAPKKPAEEKTVASAAASKTATAAKVAASARKTPDSFWVQAAAYTSKRNADEARTTLESNKIPSEVFTFTDSNGKTFYRVRVGPYVTKSEAEYWQTRIGMIGKFADAKSVIVSTAIN